MLPPPSVPKSAAAKIGDRKSLRERNKEAIERAGYEVATKIAEGKLSKQGEKASSEKRKQINRRASELAMTQGKRRGEVEEHHVRRAKRELLGLQTLPDPDNPLARRKP